MHGQDEHKRPCIFEGTLGRPSNPKSRGLAAYLLLLRVPTLELLDSLLISALLLVVQASVCAMIFEFGHELGRYPALLHALRTVACGSLRTGVAETLTATCRARADGPARPRPARVRPTGRHGVVYRRSSGAVRLRLRPGYVLDRLSSWCALFITLSKCLYFLLEPGSISVQHNVKPSVTCRLIEFFINGR